MATKKILVMGLERGGTEYTAKALQSVGIKARHEGVYNSSGYVAWGESVDVDVSHYSVGYYEKTHRTDVVIFHQTRDPVSCINTHATHFGTAGWENFKSAYHYKQHPEIFGYDDPVDRAIAYYVLQNKTIDRDHSPSFRYRVEDVDESTIDTFFSILEKTPDYDFHSTVGQVSKSTNSSTEGLKKTNYDLPYILSRKSKEARELPTLIQEYGY